MVSVLWPDAHMEGIVILDSMQTIKEAKQHLRENWVKGVNCACCGQFVKRYSYKLNVSIAVTLIEMYNLKKEWVHVNTEISPTSGGYFSLAQHWKLIYQKPLEGEDKKGSGYWALTDKGRDFVLNRIIVPTHVHMFDGRVLGFAEEHTSIVEALGKKFSYSELMGYENK